MAAKLGVLIVHGMGEQQEDYAEVFIANLVKRLQQKGMKRRDCAFVAVHWEKVFGESQREQGEYLRNASSWYQPVSRIARSFVLAYLSDAASYYASYKKIHEELYQYMRRLENLLDGPTSPILIVSHSLGSVMISDYIYDRLYGKQRDVVPYDVNSFHKMKSLKDFITLGSNIPLFKMGHNKPYGFPKPNRDFRWTNFYSGFDVLGYPLDRFYNNQSEKMTIQDIKINCGNWMTWWNWFSHDQYWSHRKVLQCITESILNRLQEENSSLHAGG